jgi:hypothetical protein
MDKRIIFTQDNGVVAVIVPADECGLTIQQIADKDVPKGKPYSIVDVDQVPTDRYFRNAWKHDSGVISVDMPKAVEIQKEKLRAERAPLLAALDAEYMKALETKDAEKEAEVATEKQRLRDITDLDALTKAKTPEELKAISCASVAKEV